MVNSQDISNGGVSRRVEFRVSKALHQKYQRSTISGSEVLLTLVGANFGQAAVAPKSFAGFNCSRAVAIIPVIVDPRFVTLCLRSPVARHYMNNWANTTAQPTFNLKDVAGLPIPFPPASERDSITRIINALDDKIELNRRMNETLEAMARALFKSWFVDFDPVRAKAEGRDPGLAKGLAELFPFGFTEGEAGEIPEGWTVKSLDQIARFLNGLALQKYPTSDSNYLPVIKIAQLRAGNAIASDRASTDVPSDYVVQDGDILFSWSGSLECVLWAGGPGALNQHLFKVTSSSYPRWLCYLGIHRHLEHFRQIAAGKATTMGHIQRHHLSEAMMPIPQDGLLNAMDSIMKPMIESLWRRNVQSRTLAELRDTLLPKLITGQLCIGEAESAVEQVA
jgi:type I restriction enzyme S subunit